ncbi:MAG: hypothetical protein ABIT36_04490 [Steroidobacteraceae bacterium]
MSEIATIYIALVGLNDQWIPVQAITRADGTFEIISRTEDPEDANWQFPSGSIVKCEERQLVDGVRRVAVSSLPPRSLKLVWPAK